MSLRPPDPSNTMIVIPARMASSRLPGKPLADIAGKPMIVQVWQRAVEARCGKVLVAAAEDAIAVEVRRAGGDAILTDPALPSGSDRVQQAVDMRDEHHRISYVVNLQGDLPAIDPSVIRACLAAFMVHDCDITTLVAPCADADEVADPNVVKAVVDFERGRSTAIARDFVRTVPADLKPPYWHHIGIYGYRRPALDRFVSLPVSPREKQHRLEQLRALDNGMTIAAARVDTVPTGVDTPADLERVRALFRHRGSAS